jgi:hypothetical protein
MCLRENSAARIAFRVTEYTPTIAKPRENRSNFWTTRGARNMTHLAALIQHVTRDELMSRVPAQELIDGDAGKAERLRSSYLAATTTPARTKDDDLFGRRPGNCGAVGENAAQGAIRVLV